MRGNSRPRAQGNLPTGPLLALGLGRAGLRGRDLPRRKGGRGLPDPCPGQRFAPPLLGQRLWVSVSPWAGPSAGSRVTCQAQTVWSYIREDGEPGDPAGRGAGPPRARAAPGCGGSDHPLCREPSHSSPPRPGQCSGVVTAAGTDEVTALRRSQGGSAALAPPGGGGGREEREGAPQPRTSARERLGQGRDTHSEPHRPPQTRGAATQRQDGDPRMAVRHTAGSRQQGNSARGREKQPLCSVAGGALLPKPQRGQKCVCLCVGVGAGGWGEGLQRGPGRWPKAPPTCRSSPTMLGASPPPRREVL